MLTIRFNRVGKKNKAQFRIVLQEHTITPGGRHVEVLGSWDPHLKKGVFKSEKIKEWIAKGAQVSDSVWNLLIKKGIIKGKKRSIKTKKSAETEIKKEENSTEIKLSGVENEKNKKESVQETVVSENKSQTEKKEQ